MTIDALYERFLGTAGACTDTRQLVQRGMFFALKGGNFNANAFAGLAVEQGCRYAVVDDETVAQDDRFLLVPDALSALQELARHHRRQFKIPMIAITGSNGKTTTKELAAAVLTAYAPTLATQGNYNNHIGVPLTLLRLERDHEFAIVEMGANHVGEIAALCAIAEPTHGMITNIGKAHLEGFGGYEGVVKAKTEMYAHLRKEKGRVFVNADDPLLMEKSEGIERITYGTGTGAVWRGSLRGVGPFLKFQWQHDGGKPVEVDTQMIGAYNLPNALAAITISGSLSVPDETIMHALTNYVPGNNRSQLIDTGRNQVIMDAYNANPTSMRAALENFALISTIEPKLAILGDMLELGDAAPTEHQIMVDLLATLGIESLVVGPLFMATTAPTAVIQCASVDDALRHLHEREGKRCSVLLKGSRGMALERLLAAL